MKTKIKAFMFKTFIKHEEDKGAEDARRTEFFCFLTNFFKLYGDRMKETLDKCWYSFSYHQ